MRVRKPVTKPLLQPKPHEHRQHLQVAQVSYISVIMLMRHAKLFCKYVLAHFCSSLRNRKRFWTVVLVCRYFLINWANIHTMMADILRNIPKLAECCRTQLISFAGAGFFRWWKYIFSRRISVYIFFCAPGRARSHCLEVATKMALATMSKMSSSIQSTTSVPASEGLKYLTLTGCSNPRPNHACFDGVHTYLRNHFSTSSIFSNFYHTIS